MNAFISIFLFCLKTNRFIKKKKKKEGEEEEEEEEEEEKQKQLVGRAEDILICSQNSNSRAYILQTVLLQTFLKNKC